ncbi:hypothetical protein E2C01_079081 [Portunus trituberculatus]|uniref:Uncharacterized protein n=1 Tax=Portunus trituberculatus TaxID=210409 RepID=A0A5B7IPB9_PORTR|nr:hypothetical protein [Portunus trituberculatus]
MQCGVEGVVRRRIGHLAEGIEAAPHWVTEVVVVVVGEGATEQLRVGVKEPRVGEAQSGHGGGAEEATPPKHEAPRGVTGRWLHSPGHYTTPHHHYNYTTSTTTAASRVTTPRKKTLVPEEEKEKEEEEEVIGR